MIRLTLRWLFLLVATIILIVSTYFYVTYDSNNPSAEDLKTCKGAIAIFKGSPQPSELFGEIYEKNKILRFFFPSNDGAVSTIKTCTEKTTPKLYLQFFQAGLFLFFSILLFFFALKRPRTF
jgi:hypothetical protein